jgi:hypothetical protein
MFKCNKQNLTKPKYKHERTKFLIFDDFIGAINGAELIKF